MNTSIKGRIATEARAVRTENGNLVVSVRVAEHKAYRDKKTGEKIKITTFYTVEAWNEVAKQIERNLQVGDLVDFKLYSKPGSWTTPKGEVKNFFVNTVREYSLVRRAGQKEEARI